MAIEYAGGTYIDQSTVLTATNVADYITLVRTNVAAAGWTVTDLGTYNMYGAIPTLFNQTNAANNDTITVVARVYTFKTTLTGAADEILIGANIQTTLFNLRAALNAEAGAGTIYGTGTTINTSLTGLAIVYLNGTSGNPALIVRSKTGSAVSVTETGNLSWYNTTTTAKTLYLLESVQTPAFQKCFAYIAEDVNSTANTLFCCMISRDQRIGVGRNTTTANTSGTTLRILANRYGFHTLLVGTFNTNGTGIFIQAPFIPSFMAPKQITGATNATPISITTSAAHGYTSGDSVLIKYVEGNTAANGLWTITVTGATTFTLATSVGNGTFSGTLGLAACQTTPGIEILENTYLNFAPTSSAGYLTSSTGYGSGVGGFSGIFDGTPLAGVGTSSFLFPRAVNTSGSNFIWVSGAGVAIEPQIIYTSLYGASVRCGGQFYNAWWSQTATAGGATNTADSHTWYGIWNSDASGQLFLLTS